MQGDRQETTESSRGNADQIPERKRRNAVVSSEIHLDTSLTKSSVSERDSVHYGLIPFASSVVASSLTVLQTA